MECKSIQKIQGLWQDRKWITKQSYYHIGQIQQYYSEDIENEQEDYDPYIFIEEPDQRIIWKQGDTLTMQFDQPH